MINLVRFAFLLFVMLPVVANAQGKNIKSLPENASLDDTRKWLVQAVEKYGSYSTQVNSASVSKVKFENCKFSFSVLKKTGSDVLDNVGVRRTKTHSASQQVAFDLPFIEQDGVAVTDYIYPDFQVITIRFRKGSEVSTTSEPSRDLEIIVRREAGEAIRAAFVHARKLCGGNEK
jgi:hypothetical protein